MARKKGTWQLLTIQDLANYRKRKGFRSDKALAEDLGVSVGSIAGWKKGVRAPSLRVQQGLVTKIKADQKPKRSAAPDDLSNLIKRLLSLATEVKDPSALIEASQRLLLVDSRA